MVMNPQPYYSLCVSLKQRTHIYNLVNIYFKIQDQKKKRSGITITTKQIHLCLSAMRLQQTTPKLRGLKG